MILSATVPWAAVTFGDVFSEAAETARVKGWDDPPATFGESIALLHSELSEALEAYRKSGKMDALVLEELADVVIRLGHLVGREGLATVQDFVTAMLKKLIKNRGRQYRHGHKKL